MVSVAKDAPLLPLRKKKRNRSPHHGKEKNRKTELQTLLP
jgi:hypothetical protein